MARGVNYYDTAWGYHNGNSELVMGKALARHPREKFYLATKFPGYDLSNMGKVEEIFEKQLEKCQVEYFDFYLFHNVCEMNIDAYLDPKYGTYDYLLAQKKNGRIRHLGFSAHGDYARDEALLRGLWQGHGVLPDPAELPGLGLPGRQAQGGAAEPVEHPRVGDGAPAGRQAGFPGPGGRGRSCKALRPDEGIPAWAFRYSAEHPRASVVTLSGMSNLEQMKENIATFQTDKPLNETGAGHAPRHCPGHGRSKIVLPCTACHYCASHCPQGLDIPSLLSLYNEHCLYRGRLHRAHGADRPCPRTSSPAPASAAAAARPSVPRASKSPRPWRTSPLSWVADASLLG